MLPARHRAESFLFLGGPQPVFDGLTVHVPSGVVIHKVDSVFLEGLEKKGVADVAKVAGDCAVCIQFAGSDSTSDLLRPVAFHDALVLATDVRSRECSQVIRDIDTPQITTASDLPERGTFCGVTFEKS